MISLEALTEGKKSKRVKLFGAEFFEIHGIKIFSLCLLETKLDKLTAMLAPRCLDGRPRTALGAAPPEQQEGKGTMPPIRKDPTATSYGCPVRAGRRTHRDDAAEGTEERCNTQSAFETTKYNSCNIHLKIDETLKNILLKHL
jgi:hypothetical protein